MKNKSKLKKIREGRRGAPQVPAEWLYLVPDEVSMRQIYDLFRESEPWKAEYWEEAGVIEIEIPEAGSVDLEEMDCDLGDEESNFYLEAHQIQTAFAVTIVPEDFEKAKAVMEYVVGKLGGFFCGDCPDFQPEVRCP